MNEQKAQKPIALIKTGCTIEKIKRDHGDFEDWFIRGLGVSEILQIDVYRHQSLPSVFDLAGIVITGSASMVSAHEDWSEYTAEWLGKAVQKGIPILGVCYGHQLLAHALGGHVGPNPAGRQIGTIHTQLLDASKSDPLIGHLPGTFACQATHLEAVLELPSYAERLATSPKDTNFAIRFAENTWGVQFHPEFSGLVMSKYIRYRANALRKEGIDPEELLSKTAETMKAQSILPKFVEIVLSNRRQSLEN